MSAFVRCSLVLVTVLFLGLVDTWAGAGASAQSVSSDHPPKSNKPSMKRHHGESTPVFDGAAIYARYCALCHGEDRQGYAADHAPSLRSPELMGAAPGSYLWSAISYGRPGTAMSAFEHSQGGPLSHDDLHALVDWLIETSGVYRQPVPDRRISGEATKGAEVYATHCTSCHGENGEGGTGTALGNSVFLATVTDAYLHYTVTKGRTGTPMPAFGKTLTRSEVRDVVAFLRSKELGWEATEPSLLSPPDPAKAVLNPNAPMASLEERDGRFVSADSVAEAMKTGERLVLLDARPMSDWQRAHIPGALPVPFYDGVDELLPYLPNDGTPIVAYCACPHAASGKVVDALQSAGFEAARILDEGVLVWTSRGYPIARGAKR